MPSEYNIFRWYRPSWGRYTQSDPSGLRSDTNLYRYTFNNPVRYVDPHGLVTWRCDISSVGVGHAIFGFQDMNAKCYGPCIKKRQWYVELDFKLAGFSVGFPPITWSLDESVELTDPFPHANPQNLAGSASVKNLSASWGKGVSHTEYEIGWATNHPDARSSSTGFGASFDVLWGDGWIVDKRELCCQ